MRALAGLLHVQAEHLGRQHHVLENGAPGQQDRALEHHADVAPRAVDRLAVEHHLATS
jgi:hypothetical protein